MLFSVFFVILFVILFVTFGIVVVMGLDWKAFQVVDGDYPRAYAVYNDIISPNTHWIGTPNHTETAVHRLYEKGNLTNESRQNYLLLSLMVLIVLMKMIYMEE